jgi:hypothetical protein
MAAPRGRVSIPRSRSRILDESTLTLRGNSTTSGRITFDLHRHAYKARHRRRTVWIDRLAEGLWGDRVPSSGAKMVQLYVSHLRRLLGESGARIVTHGRGYELQSADGEVDVARAERLLEESRPREALALWRGEPLADLADEPFAGAEIRRLASASLIRRRFAPHWLRHAHAVALAPEDVPLNVIQRPSVRHGADRKNASLSNHPTVA